MYIITRITDKTLAIMTADLHNYTDYLMRLAYSFTNDTNDAKDLFQETMLKAISKFHQFKPGTNLKAWVTTIMRNAYINQYRKNKRRRAYSLDEFDRGVYTPTEDNMSESNMISEEIMKQMETLRPNYKSLLEMIMNGYQYDQIAEHYQLPLGTVKSRIHLARKELYQKLQLAEILN